MSYSIVIAGASTADAISKIAGEFDKVVDQQPTHAADRDAAVATATALAGLLQEPIGNEQVNINISGSLGWVHSGTSPTKFISGNLYVTVSIGQKS